MSKARPLPDWPRAMGAALAAAYLDVSETTFHRVIAPDLAAVPLTPGRVAWLREDLDRWLDAKAGRVPASSQGNPWHA
jgi:predicted DNA-binding transcriptional regulator AlpA